MAHWKHLFRRYSSLLADRYDNLSSGIRHRLGFNGPVHIVPYRSYGTADRIYIKGRVLEDKGITKATDKDSIMSNLLNMYKRFESDEVRDAVLRVRFQDQEHQVLTDKEGYFTINLMPGPLSPGRLWQEASLELVSAPAPFDPGLSHHAEVLVPPDDAEYGIISDIDDTVVKTSATDILAMSRTVLLHNAHTRLPFAGVSAFYKALQRGRNGRCNNPFFYVSSSPWNMYDLLQDFLDLNGIPAGPLLLRDFGLRLGRMFHSGHMAHKFREIEDILFTYPRLKFILIGDSGQEDPVIYQEVVRKFPGRILAIYIRDVQVPERERIAVKISESLGADKVDMIIVDNTVEAAAHAARTGLISSDFIPEIEHVKAEDKGQI
jgi:phosphatidate phosphatase APP1